MEAADVSLATDLARQAVGAPDGLPAAVVVVRRLDRDAEYLLVQLGRPGEPGWVAAVDPTHQDVMSWAANPSGASTVPARPAGGPPEDAPPDDGPTGWSEWVWRPSVHSRSPLYPLLRITTDGHERFVDLAGQVHEHLPDAHA